MTRKEEILNAINVCEILISHFWNSNFFKELNTAKEALEKQIPKKPKLFKGNEGNYDICPCCDGLLVYYLEHCHMCGQAIDWEEV